MAGGRRGGLVAALVMGGTDLVVRARYDQASFTGSVLMVLAARRRLPGRLAENAQTRLRRAIELEAATRERERLARDIHDSVLQVLALVKRRGAGLDGEAGELARLAGEQEAALRALVTGALAGTRRRDGGPDDGCAVRRGQGLGVRPGRRGALPAWPARDIAAAVAAAGQRGRHCAPGTKVWVLVEDEPAGVTVSVRDDGCGIPPAGSAKPGPGPARGGPVDRGRIDELGGTVTRHLGALVRGPRWKSRSGRLDSVSRDEFPGPCE